jgi:uncharacterized caspase-like protein
LVGTLRDWLDRQSGRHRISVTIDGDTIELDRASAAQRQELLEPLSGAIRAADAMGRRLALLIATYQYQDTGLRQLTSPAHDAEALAAVLRDPAIAGFQVTTLINEPHYRVGEAIGDFYRDWRHDDLTLLYFTGDGLKDDDGRLYLAMTDTRRDGLPFTGLPAANVDRAMEGCVSRQKVLVLDCCYSGAPTSRAARSSPGTSTGRCRRTSTTRSRARSPRTGSPSSTG